MDADVERKHVEPRATEFVSSPRAEGPAEYSPGLALGMLRMCLLTPGISLPHRGEGWGGGLLTGSDLHPSLGCDASLTPWHNHIHNLALTDEATNCGPAPAADGPKGIGYPQVPSRWMRTLGKNM